MSQQVQSATTVWGTSELRNCIVSFLPDPGNAACVSRVFRQTVEERRGELLEKIQAHPLIRFLVEFSPPEQTATTKLRAVMRQLQIAEDVHRFFYSCLRRLPRAEAFPLEPIVDEAFRFIKLANRTNYSDYFFSALLMRDIEQIGKYRLEFIDQKMMPKALDICLKRKWIDLFRVFAKHYDPRRIDLFDALRRAKADRDLAYVEQLRALPISFNEMAKQLTDGDYWHLLVESRGRYPFDIDWIFARVCEEGDNSAIEELVDAWPSNQHTYIHDPIDGIYYPALEEDPNAHQYDGFHYALLTVARNRNAAGLRVILTSMEERGRLQLQPRPRYSIDPRIIAHVERYLRNQGYDEGLQILREVFPPAEEEAVPPPPRRMRLT